MKKSMTLLLAGMMLLGMVTVANATTTISNINDGFFIGIFSPFGASGTATVGQTFNLSAETTGDDNLLDSVTFWITASEGNIEFKFYLYEWDGAKIMGDPLFESGELSSTQSDDDGKLTVDVGGVELNFAQDYVFFVSASAGSGSIDAVFYFDFFGIPDPTPAHKLVFYNPSSTEWNISSVDMAFEMLLSASGPELGPELGSEPGPELEPEPTATFELTRAKVDLKKGKIKLDGQVILPEGVTYDEYLVPEGSVTLRLFELNQLVEAVEESVEEVYVVDESVELEVKGRKGEKWEYKNRHAVEVTEYKVHWKDDRTGTVKIKADFDPTLVDLSRLTPKLVAEFTLGDLGFELTISENGEYHCKLKKKKWDFRNKP